MGKDEQLSAWDEEEEHVQLSHSFEPSKSISEHDSESAILIFSKVKLSQIFSHKTESHYL